MSLEKISRTGSQKALMGGVEQDELKEILTRGRKRIEDDVENQPNRNYETEKIALDRARRKLEKKLAKFRKDKRELTMLQQQVEKEKQIFGMKLGRKQGHDFKPAEYLEELQDAILKSISAKQQAKDELENLRSYEKLIHEKANKLKIKEALMDTLREREEDLEKKQTELRETENDFESQSHYLQEWENRLQQERDDLQKQLEESNKKSEEIDIFEMNLQEKDLQLKELEAEIKISTRNLQKEREDWDDRKKQIYFDKMFEEKRVEIEVQQQKLNKQMAEATGMKKAQELTSADLQRQLQTMDKKQSEMQKMNKELEEQLAMIDKKTLETTKKEEELNKRSKDLETAWNKHHEKSKELKMQQEQIQNEYSKLQTWFEKKVRAELAREKKTIDEERRKLQEDSKELKRSSEEFNKEKTEFWKRRSRDESEIIRLKGEIKREKVQTERVQARLEERRKGVDKIEYQVKQEKKRLQKLNQQLQSDRLELKVTVEKEILDKYKTMISYAENERKELTKEREAFAAERRRQKQEKLEIADTREHLENEIKWRVNSEIALKEDELVMRENEVIQKNEEIQLELTKMKEVQQAIKAREEKTNELRRQLDERLENANYKLELAAQKERDLNNEKSIFEEEQDRSRKAIWKEKTNFERSTEAQKRKIANINTELELRIRDIEKREEQTSARVLRITKEWETLEREGDKLAEVTARMQAEAMRRLKSVKDEKDWVEKVRTELTQSKKDLYSSFSETKKDLTVGTTLHLPGGCKVRESTTCIEGHALDGVPSINRNTQSDRDLEERFNPKLQVQDTIPLPSKSTISDSHTDNISVIYQGVYLAQSKTDSISPAIHLKNAKAKSPMWRTFHPTTSDNEQCESSRIPSKFLINMIECGEHTTTTFFFLGPEKKMIKTIKGVMMDISDKLKSLVESNEVVELPDITTVGFESMLEFVYSDTCSLTTENLVPTMACASKFDLIDLYRTCFDWLEINLCASDTVRILDDCITHSPALGPNAKHAIEKSAWDLMISDGGGVKDVLGRLFQTKDKNWVRNVVEGNSLVCSEHILFDAIAHWACHQTNLKLSGSKVITLEDWKITDDEKSSQKSVAHREVQNLIAEIIPSVRFPTMPAEYITASKLIASMLQPIEILEVLRYQHDPEISRTKFQKVPRYKTVEVSQEGICAQSSEHFAVVATNADTAHYENSSVGEVGSLKTAGRLLAADLAIAKRLFQNDIPIEGQDGLNVAQTKYDYQPWWDMDLGRLCRIQKIQVYLGEPVRAQEQKWRSRPEETNDMLPLVLCLARDEFPNMEGTLLQSVQMSVKSKYFDRVPAKTKRQSIVLEWEPALVAARTFRIQCERQTILRILHVKIFSAEPAVSGPMPQIRTPKFS